MLAFKTSGLIQETQIIYADSCLNHCKEYVSTSCGKEDVFCFFLSIESHMVVVAGREERETERKEELFFPASWFCCLSAKWCK